MRYKRSIFASFFPLQWLGAFACCALFIVGGCGSQSNSSSTGSAQAVQKIKAPNFRLTDLSGKTFSLADFKGRVVFLDFWATWCPPCVMSAPDVEKIANDYAGKPVEVISVSLDQTVEPVKQFMRNHQMSNRVALAGTSGIEEKYNIRGIPAFYMIDQEGNLVGRWEGYNPALARLWRKELDRLLKV